MNLVSEGMNPTMSPTPEVSVVMAGFNVESTVERAIHSVLNQSYTDLELIVVDDASTDGTASRLELLKDKLADDRLKVIRLSANGGPSAARNAGLDAARGQFLSFIDADDMYEPEFISTLHAAMSTECDIAIAGHWVVRADGTSFERHSSFVGETSGENAMRAAMADQILPFIWDKLYRRTLFDGIRYPLGAARFEDLAVNIALYPRCRRVKSLSQPLHRYFVSGGSLTWGKVPSESDADLAVQHLHTLLPPRLRQGRNRLYYEAMRLLITMTIAQSAIMKLPNQPAARMTIDECRNSLTLSRIALSLPVRPKFAVAAMLLKFLPRTFASLYRRHSETNYGLS